MELSQALQETGCAIYTNGDCVTSVERLTDKDFLLMTRRGVCILQCQITKLKKITKHPIYEHHKWSPGRVQFVQVLVPGWNEVRGVTTSIYSGIAR